MGCCHSKAVPVHVASDGRRTPTKTLCEHPNGTNRHGNCNDGGAAGGKTGALGTGAEEQANEESNPEQSGVVGKSTARGSVSVASTRAVSVPRLLMYS